jgi:hypothetical protein
MLWGAFDRRHRTWHDLLAGTRVVSSATGRRRLITGLVPILAIGVAGAWYFGAPLDSYIATLRMAVPKDARLESEMRPAALLSEVGLIPGPDIALAAGWVDRNGADPLAYASAKARAHDLVMFGEMHEQGDSLEWFNQAIPVLYNEGGVTCIAMEVLLAEDDAAIERVVNAPTFDQEAATALARHQPWAMWGWQEYWRVFETVWRVNQGVGDDHPKLRLIGLDRPMDAPSLLMMGIGDVPVKEQVPVLEKLRLWRLPKLLALMVLRDGAMANEVEREILAKHERGVVWIGSMHAAVGCRLPGRQQWGQFGLMLRHRYGDRVFSVRLHQMDIPASAMDPTITATPRMASFIEDIMAQRGRAAVGFDLAGSPLALVRDRGSMEYAISPSVGLGDIADGYIYLKNWRDLRHCSWQAGYISDDMFTEYKPMYQALAQRAGTSARTASEMNRVFREMK